MNHVIEHVASIQEFIDQVDRISKKGATVHAATPHFSSIDSYSDPTHRLHLSSEWLAIMND